MQMLKFGQVINLEVLETKSVNKPAEELKDKLAKDDAVRAGEMEEWEVQLCAVDG